MYSILIHMFSSMPKINLLICTKSVPFIHALIFSALSDFLFPFFFHYPPSSLHIWQLQFQTITLQANNSWKCWPLLRGCGRCATILLDLKLTHLDMSVVWLSVSLRTTIKNACWKEIGLCAKKFVNNSRYISQHNKRGEGLHEL
jgi:hypothetical protein